MMNSHKNQNTPISSFIETRLAYFVEANHIKTLHSKTISLWHNISKDC